MTTLLPTPKIISEIFHKLGGDVAVLSGGGQLGVHSPINGKLIASLRFDTQITFQQKINEAIRAQKEWSKLSLSERQDFLIHLAKTTEDYKKDLAPFITYEAGKVLKESEGEVSNIKGTIDTTIKNVTARNKEDSTREKWKPLGVIGLITSYNFPLAVAGWTIAPALLSGNTVLWKPSEKTPITALAFELIFRKAVNSYTKAKVPEALLTVVLGKSDIGEQMVANEHVSMISATGSVGMGKGIKAVTAKKSKASYKPILELGGNNAVIISKNNDDAGLEFAASSILKSVFATGGQRCTNTRRVIVHHDVFGKFSAIMKDKFHSFIQSAAICNPVESKDDVYMYAPLIDKRAYEEFVFAKVEAEKEGGTIHFGKRMLEKEFPDAYYVAPALALMAKHSDIMKKETFAPILFVAPYDGNIEEAVKLVNLPENGGLVNGIYTKDESEIAAFVENNLAGHTVINSPKGTGTPAHGQGFGGNRDSGEGVILSPDPLLYFTEEGQKKINILKTGTEPAAQPDGVTAYRMCHKDGSVSRIIIHPKS